MLKFFKNIFANKPAHETAVETVTHAPRIPSAAPPRAVTPSPTRPQAPVRPQAPIPSRQSFNAHPSPSQLTPSSVPQSHAPHANGNGGSKSLQISLQSVLNNLSIELKGRVKQTDIAGAEISLPLETVLSQLSTGTVKITFGQLRRAAPQLFSAQTDMDQTPVVLPLGEILAQLNPALLFRRQDQKHIEVPEDVRSPFGDHGSGLIFSVGPNKAQAPAPTPLPPPQAAAPAPRPVTPPPALVAMPTVPFRPAAPKSAVPPVAPPAPTAVPAPAPISMSPPKLNFSPAAAPAAPRPAAPVSFQTQKTMASLAQGPTLDLALSSLIPAWPESLKLEIAQSSELGDAVIAVPMDTLKQAMQRGKVFFTWKLIRSWIKPAVSPTVSAHDNTSLELPLQVIAPLFVARERDLAKSKQKVAIDETIPNLFFGFPQPESSDPSAPPTPAACAVTKPIDTNYFPKDEVEGAAAVAEKPSPRSTPGGTAFIARCATPNEIVSRAAALNGVAGALIALPDGLMVASKLSTDLNGDTIAAFLPQIFGKVNQCTKELRMGELNNLNFTVGQVPWKIFRVNAIFFAAFGRAGQPMPSAELAALAAELDRKKQ